MTEEELAAAANATGKAIKLASELLGPVSGALVGYFGGDKIRQLQFLNLDRLKRESDRVLRHRDAVDRVEEISLSIAGPLISYAADESRPEIADLWALLLANASDPTRRRFVRRDVIDAVNSLEPTDAQFLEAIRVAKVPNRDLMKHILETAKLDPIEYEASKESLVRAGLLSTSNIEGIIQLTGLGRVLLLATANERA